MKRLHSFLLQSYLGPLIMTFFISLFILLMQFLWKYIDDLAGKGLDWTVIAELIIYASARLVPMALPLAVLLSSIMTFGNMGENFELTAIKSAGISLQRFMSPLIYLIIVISIAAFFYSNHVIPYTNLKTGALIYDVKHQRPELQIKEGIFYNGIEGYSIKIAKKNHKTNLLQNIMVYDHKNNKENLKVTVADSGYMRMTADESNIILTLYNGYSYEEVEESRKDRRQTEKKHPHQRNNFEKQVVIFELTGLDFSRTDEELFKNNFQMLNLKQLSYFEDSLEKEYSYMVSDFAELLKRSNYFKRENTLNQEIKSKRKREFKPNYDSLLSSKSDNLHSKIIEPNKRTFHTDSFIVQEVNKKQDSIENQDSSIYTTHKKLINKKSNVNDFYKSLQLNEKKSAIEYALSFARSAQSSVDDSRKTFNYRQDRIRRHQIEWHRKFSLSFACFVFFFIGAPFGAIVRKGGFGTPVVISILFFIFYYILSIAGEKFTREGIMPAYIGMWISSFVLMPLGIFLTYKATTDSVILNSDTYFLLIKKFIARFKKNTPESTN